jgi:hypothetical protein
MNRLILLTSSILICAMSTLYAPDSKTVTVWRYARITAYGGKTHVDRLGKPLKNNTCAVSIGLPYGTVINIPDHGKTVLAKDSVPDSSIKKLFNDANRKGEPINIIVDVCYPEIKSEKKLQKLDMGFHAVYYEEAIDE